MLEFSPYIAKQRKCIKHNVTNNCRRIVALPVDYIETNNEVILRPVNTISRLWVVWDNIIWCAHYNLLILPKVSIGLHPNYYIHMKLSKYSYQLLVNIYINCYFCFRFENIMSDSSTSVHRLATRIVETQMRLLIQSYLNPRKISCMLDVRVACVVHKLRGIWVYIHLSHHD